jgi:UPF0755 protein
MKFVRSAGPFLAAAMLAAILAGAFLFHRVTRPYQGFTGTVYVDLPRGTSTAAMAQLLSQAGVVRSRWDFIVARLANRSRVLQAGEYRFDRPASAVEVLGRIARGDIFYYTLAVPEGKNIFDIGAAAEDLGLFSAAISTPRLPPSKAIFSRTPTSSAASPRRRSCAA